MKKITLLLALLISSIGFSQTELLTNGDFANDTDSWVGGAEFSVVAGEAYISSTNAGGDLWSTQLVQANMSFVNGAEYVLKFKARAAANRKMTVAIQNVNEWSDQFRSDYDLTTTMTEFTATFNASKDFANVQIGFLMAASGSTEAIYIDDVSIVTMAVVTPTCSDGVQNGDETGVDCGGSCAPCAAAPTPPATAAPVPSSRNEWDVISLYSDAYTQTAVTNFDAGWCGAGSIEEIEVAGDKMLLWKSNPCQGIEFTSIDATAFTHMHIDLYIAAGTDVIGKVWNLKFVDTADNQALEVNFNDASSPALEAGKWISIDVPVNLADFDKLNQFGVTSGNLNNMAWYDNLYFYRAPTASVDNNQLLGFSMYPNPASNRLNISAKETIQNADIFNVLGKKVMSVNINKTSESIDVSNLNSGIYLVKYNVNGTVGTAKFIKQ